MKRTSLKRRKGIRPQSERARAKAAERAEALPAHFGHRPDCAGSSRIPAAGCPIYPHPADDGHEPRKRSQGADPADPSQVIPLCRAAHDWVHANPANAAGRYTRDGRAFLILSSVPPSG